MGSISGGSAPTRAAAVHACYLLGIVAAIVVARVEAPHIVAF